MLFRLNYFINLVLSSLYILIGIFGFIGEDKLDEDSTIALLFIFITFPVFIVLSIICIRVNKQNRDRIVISSKLKITGIIISVIAGLLSVLAIFYCVEAYVNLSSGSLFTRSDKWAFIQLVLLITMFLGISSIVNIIFFGRSLRKNKMLFIEEINTIGTDVS